MKNLQSQSLPAVEQPEKSLQGDQGKPENPKEYKYICSKCSAGSNSSMMLEQDCNKIYCNGVYIENKSRCEKELLIEKYFGLPNNIDHASRIVTDYTVLVDLLYAFEASQQSLQLNPNVPDGSRILGYFEYDLKAGTEKYTPASQQPSQPEGKTLEEPFGYVFENIFYKNLDQMSGQTFSEGNEPLAVYANQPCKEWIKCEEEAEKQVRVRKMQFTASDIHQFFKALRDFGYSVVRPTPPQK